MQMKSGSLKFRGDITITVTSRLTNRVLQRLEVRNKIVQVGLNAFPYFLSQREDEPNGTNYETPNMRLAHLRVGTGDTPAAKTNTALVTHVPAFDVALTSDNFSPEETDEGTLVIRATLPAQTGATSYRLSEAGLFLANGWLFARQAHSPIDTAPGLQLDYAWTLSFMA